MGSSLQDWVTQMPVICGTERKRPSRKDGIESGYHSILDRTARVDCYLLSESLSNSYLYQRNILGLYLM